MRVCLQRVSKASICIDDSVTKNIDKGIVLLLGVKDTDTLQDVEKLADKCANLRIFEDEFGKMNLSSMDLHLDCMVVSNFTLYADTKTGRRPSFISAAKKPLSIDAYNLFVQSMKNKGFNKVVTGEFGADMKIELINDGPVTIILDTQDWQ